MDLGSHKRYWQDTYQSRIKGDEPTAKWPGDAGTEYYRLILLHILGRHDEFLEREHEVNENEEELFIMPGDAG